MSGWLLTRQHVIPIDDLRDHVVDSSCWCNPTPDIEEPTVVIHHSMDGREHYETGERTAS